jgi:hypothetical protein
MAGSLYYPCHIHTIIKDNKMEFITVTEAMKIIGVTRPILIQYINDYQLGIKVGGQYRINPNMLNKFVQIREKSQKENLSLRETWNKENG